LRTPSFHTAFVGLVILSALFLIVNSNGEILTAGRFPGPVVPATGAGRMGDAMAKRDDTVSGPGLR